MPKTNIEYSYTGNIKDGLLIGGNTSVRALATNMAPMTDHHESTLRFFY